jgi:hypothetical protein
MKLASYLRVLSTNECNDFAVRTYLELRDYLVCSKSAITNIC